MQVVTTVKVDAVVSGCERFCMGIMIGGAMIIGLCDGDDDASN